MPASGVELAPGARSLVSGFQSYRLVRAGQHAVPSGSEAQCATSSCWAERSSIVEDDEGAAHAEHMEMPKDGEAWVGNAIEAGSTWTAEDAATAAGRTGFDADHVAMEMRQMLGSWTAACGRTWGDREGEAFGRRPSYRECLLYCEIAFCQPFCANEMIDDSIRRTKQVKHGIQQRNVMNRGREGKGIKTYRRMYIRC